jgi:ubiquinone biosynthesis protein UbiJ
MSEPTDWLHSKATIQEHHFQGTPLISRLREAWASVAARWMVRAVVQQQNEFNHLLVLRLQDVDARIIAQDKDTTQLRHDLAEVTAQLVQNRRLLEQIAQRLDRLERQA